MCFTQFFCLDTYNTDDIAINKPCKLNFTVFYNGLSYEFANKPCKLNFTVFYNGLSYEFAAVLSGLYLV